MRYFGVVAQLVSVYGESRFLLHMKRDLTMTSFLQSY